MGAVIASPATAQDAAFRALFPSLDARVHLASCSYAPRGTFVDGALDEMLRALEGDAPWPVYEHQVDVLRARVAELLGAGAHQVALLPNATISAFQAVNSQAWTRRPRIVMSAAEFPSLAQVWHAQAARGAEVVLVERASGDASLLDAYRRAIDERTGWVSVPAVDYLTGARLPVREIAGLARAHGAASFCDAYQWVGTEPVDACALGVDYMVAGAMKYLLGLPGIAFLYARQPEAVARASELTGWQARVDPFAFDPARLDYPPTARRFETGTPAIASVFAAAAGVRVLQALTLPRVAEHIAWLKRYLVDALDDAGMAPRWLADPARTGAHVSLRVADPRPLLHEFAARRIQVSPRLDAIRVAFHAFNTERDVDALCAALVARRDAVAA